MAGELGWNTTGVVGNDLEVCPWCNRGLVKPVKLKKFELKKNHLNNIFIKH